MASGWDNAYGDLPGLFVKSFLDAENKRREDEASLAGLRQFTASFPNAFPSMGQPTPELARGVSPFLKEGYHQMARVAGEKELVPVRGEEARVTNRARVDEELRKERELVPMRAAEARQTAAATAAAKAEEQRTTMRQEAESLGPMIEGLIGSPDVPDQQKVFLRGIHGAVTSGKPVDPGLIRTIMGEYAKRFGSAPVPPVPVGSQRTTHYDATGRPTYTDAPEQIGPQAMAAQARINEALKQGMQPDPGDMRVIDLARGIFSVAPGGSAYRSSDAINAPGGQPPAGQQGQSPGSLTPVVSRPPQPTAEEVRADSDARSTVDELRRIADEADKMPQLKDAKGRTSLRVRAFIQGRTTFETLTPEEQSYVSGHDWLRMLFERAQSGGVSIFRSPSMIRMLNEAVGNYSSPGTATRLRTLADMAERGITTHGVGQEQAGRAVTAPPSQYPTPQQPAPKKMPPQGEGFPDYETWKRQRQGQR